MTQHPSALPPEITVFERGWLSANNILFMGQHDTALVDTGYCLHAAQTEDLVRDALGGRPLDRVLNTHLHSDHCGGNAALQQAWPGVLTAIPPGQADHVRQWDPYALSYAPTGQECPQFRADVLLEPGSCMLLGDKPWQVHAAPGHDPHSVVLFNPQDGVLISADALWGNGFGVVFPELDGEPGFDDVGRVLDLIESLPVRCVIPGHGPAFSDVAPALQRARERLAAFKSDPARHLRHGVKVLLKYHLMEEQSQPLAELRQWMRDVPLLRSVWLALGRPDGDLAAWCEQVLHELLGGGALQLRGEVVFDA